MEERKILADRHRGQSWPKMLRKADGREWDNNINDSGYKQLWCGDQIGVNENPLNSPFNADLFEVTGKISVDTAPYRLIIIIIR
jgi:hypothetical protein